jgi:hypothetical protein
VYIVGEDKMQLELFARIETVTQIVIDEDQLTLDMQKRMFNKNDKQTIKNKIVSGDYGARFHPEMKKVSLDIDGYSFLLDAEVLK